MSPRQECLVFVAANSPLTCSYVRSIYDFTNYIDTIPENTIERELWLSFTATGILDYTKLDWARLSWFEELRDIPVVHAVERYSYASTSRINQGARLGE